MHSWSGSRVFRDDLHVSILLTYAAYCGSMLGEVIEAAAALADETEPTIEEALLCYHRLADPLDHAAQLWVSVAFLLVRHARLAATLPGGCASLEPL